MNYHQVHIRNGLTGELLADVDASSTVDGLAYYLESRRIDEEHAANLRRDYVTTTWPTEGREHGEWVYEQRNPITNVLELQLTAMEVK